MGNIDFSRMITAEQQVRDTERAEAEHYLLSTDWMAIRAAETGTPMPEKIREARRLARQTLSA